jgi:hypothetical protein
MTAAVVPSVDLDAVCDSLFRDAHVRVRLARDYDFAVPASATALRRALVASFDQARGPGSDSASMDAGEVFRAAVRAVGSNNRSWPTFVRGEPKLRALLLEYDPSATASALRTGALLPDAIARWLPGQTGPADARAITKWAHLLADAPDYHAALLRLRHRLGHSEARLPERPLLTAVILGSGIPGPIGAEPPKGLASWKAPGMGPILASEFLRNLHWSAFKPDRHLQRLFGRWFPEILPASELRAQALSQLLGTRRADLSRFLTYSLLGIAVTPASSSFTEVDNLVWALGAYVEKKGRESTRCYRVDGRR